MSNTVQSFGVTLRRLRVAARRASMSPSRVWSRALLVGALAVGLSTGQRLDAQAFNYPSMQVPTASTRDYTGALSGGAGSTALFQWREGWGSGRHLQLDVGLADRKGNDHLLLFVGGGFAQEVARASGDQPLDMLYTAGVGASFGSGVSLVRISPAGLSLGHTFDLDEGMQLTPYIHPRVSVDLCSTCGRNRNGRSEVTVPFDIGVNYQVNREFALRVAGSFSGSDLLGPDDTFALGFTWTPRPLYVRGQ